MGYGLQRETIGDWLRLARPRTNNAWCFDKVKLDQTVDCFDKGDTDGERRKVKGRGAQDALLMSGDASEGPALLELDLSRTSPCSSP